MALVIILGPERGTGGRHGTYAAAPWGGLWLGAICPTVLPDVDPSERSGSAPARRAARFRSSPITVALTPAPTSPSLSIEVRRIASTRHVFVAAAGVGVAIHGAFALAGSTSAVIDDWLYCALFLLAAASCALRGRRGDGRGAWTVAAAGGRVGGSGDRLPAVGAESSQRVPTGHAGDAVRRFQPRLHHARTARARAGPPIRRGARARWRADRACRCRGRRRAAVPNAPRRTRAWTGRTAEAVPDRCAVRPGVRGHRPGDDRLATGAGVGPDRHGDRGQCGR